MSSTPDAGGSSSWISQIVKQVENFFDPKPVGAPAQPCPLSGVANPPTAAPAADSPVINIDKSVQYLDSNAEDSSQGWCATYTREAIEAGGVTLAHPSSGLAKDYGPSLEQAGFTEVSDDDYQPQKGDVVVIQPPEGETAGHMAMYDGTQWVSDFKQRTMYPGQAYRDNEPAYAIYRP
jgi:hypothetical protein